MTSEKVCQICGHAPTRTIAATERYFGLGGEYFYDQCGDCGSLALTNVPEDMRPFYPAASYYSLAAATAPVHTKNSLKRLVVERRNAWQMFANQALRSFIAKWKPSAQSAWLAENYLSPPPKHPSLKMRILDVGSGGGRLLSKFDAVGFTSLNGIDPFLNGDDLTIGNVRIRRKTSQEIQNEKYDLITCDHVLEHIVDQRRALTEMRDLLAEGGTLRLEVPVADCDAFDEYGRDWVELDPPRHVFLHTRKSLRALAAQIGLTVLREMETGGSFEFWGSEMYRRGITFYDPQLERDHTDVDLFPKKQIDKFQEKSRKAIQSRRGGRVAMIFGVADKGDSENKK